MSAHAWRMVIVIYLLYEVATIAAYLNSNVLLIAGIGLAYYILVIRFPIYTKKMEDIDGKEL